MAIKGEKEKDSPRWKIRLDFRQIFHPSIEHCIKYHGSKNAAGKTIPFSMYIGMVRPFDNLAKKSSANNRRRKMEV